MIDSEKKYVVVADGKTYRFNEQDWFANKDEFMKDFPQAEIAEVDAYKAEDLDDNDSIFINAGGKNYTFSGKDWKANESEFMKDFPQAQVARVRGVDYYYNQANEIDEKIRQKDDAIKSWQDSRTERTGLDWSSVMMQQAGLSPIGAGFDPERDAALATYAAEGTRLQQERDELQKQFDSNPRVIEAKERAEQMQKEYHDNLVKQVDDTLASYSKDKDVVDTKMREIDSKMAALDGQYGSISSQVGPSGETAEKVREFDKMGAAKEMLDHAKDIREGKAKGFWKGGAHFFEKEIEGIMYQTESDTMVQIAMILKNLNDKVGNLNENLTPEVIDENLSKDDALLLRSYFDLMSAEKTKGTGWGFKAGEIAAAAIPFALEFAAIGGFADDVAKGATKGLQLGLERWVAKGIEQGGKAVGRKVAKYGAEMLTTGLLKAGIMTAMRPSTYSTIAQHLPTIDDEGNVKLGKNALIGTLDATAETISELSGGVIEDILGLGLKWGKGMTAKMFGESVKNIKFAEWAKALTNGVFGDYLKQAGFHGLPIEMLEEVVGNAGRMLYGDDSIKTMFEDGNGKAMLLGFVPMSLFGGAMSVGAFREVDERAARLGDKLNGLLLDKGFTANRANALTERRTDKSPLELSIQMNELREELKKKGATQEELDMVDAYAVAVAEFQTMRGVTEIKEKQDLDEVRTELTNQYGTYAHNGKVTTAKTTDGRSVFIVSDKSATGEYAAVDMQTGQHITISDADIATQNNAQGQPVQALSSKPENQYLNDRLKEKNDLKEAERILQEKNEQIGKIRELMPEQLNLGTEGEPNMVVVKSQDAKGVSVVDANGNEAKMSWDAVGRVMGMPIHTFTDMELAEMEAQEIALKREELKATRAKTYAENNNVTEELNQIKEKLNDITPKPEAEYTNEETGEVDEVSFWENDPEGFCEWNDRQNKDGGADSIEQLENAMESLSSQLDVATKASKTDNPLSRKAAKREVQRLSERLQRLQAIRNGYLEKFTEQLMSVSDTAEESAETLIAMRERINEWREKFGLDESKLVVYESLDEVEREDWRRRIMADETHGWQSNKKAYIYLPHVKDVQTLDKAVMHEVVTHFGLRTLLGGKDYNALMDKVWNMMSDSARRTMSFYPGVMNKEGDARRRAAAEEFVAMVGEYIVMDTASAEQKSIWKRISDSIAEKFDNMQTKLNGVDVAGIVKDNYTRLEAKTKEEAQNAREAATEAKAEEAAETPAPVEVVTDIVDAAQTEKPAIDVAPNDDTDYSTKTESYLVQQIRGYAKSKEGKKAGWTDKKIEDIIAETSALITAIHNCSTGNEFYDEFAAKDPTFRLDWRDGQLKPIVTWTRANIEYKYDMSADLLCVNNEGLEEVLSSEQMVALMPLFNTSKKDEVTIKDMKGKEKTAKVEIGFSQDDYLELYNTLKDLGFVVPCKGCFDAAGRFKMLPSVAYKFAAAVNAVIDERNADPEAFDAALKKKAGKTATIDGLPTSAKTKLDAIRAGVAGDNLTEHVKWTQLMSADGQTKMLSDWGGIFRAWQRTGAGRPKDKLLPEPYYGDIVSQQTTIIGKYGEKTPSFKDILVNTGTGLRRNSHSEFRPVLAVDEIQFMRDAFIKNLTVFKYMKELDDVRLFGNLGVKFNMSFFPEFVEGTKAAGLDLNGDYIPSEESVGAREFPYIGEDGKKHYDGRKGWEEAQKHINKDVSLSSVILSIPHLIKAMTDVPTTFDKSGIWGSLIPFHSSGATSLALFLQGLGKARANGVGHGFEEAFTRYGEGVTNFEAVQNDRFGKGWVIVEGKKAGEAVEEGHKLEFVNGTHYYNSEMGLHLFASTYVFDSELPEGAMNEDGTLNLSADEIKKIGHAYEIDYNNKVREIGTPTAYAEAADHYLQFLPTIGLKPRFDFDVPEEIFLQMCEDANVDPMHPKLGWKGAGNAWNPIHSAAYYSLFCDYGMTDPATGEWAPHNPVGYVNENGEREFRMPENTVEIVKEGLDRYSNIRRSESAKIDEAINEFARRSVEKGRISQEAVDSVLGKENTTKSDTTNDFEGNTFFKTIFNPAIEVLEQTGISINDDALMKEYGLSDIELSKRGNYVTLSKIIVNDKGKGSGTRFMNDLTKVADESGWTLALTPDTAYGASSVSRLKKFYKQFGFKDNKGRNADFNTKESMVRTPDTMFKTSPRTDEQRTALFNAAKEEFGVTNNFGVAGYMLPDGTLLDFSEVKDGGPANVRTRDHREIGGIMEDREYDTRTEYITDFLNEGAIRIMPESDAINLSVAPSEEQRKKLLDYFYKKDGYIILELDNPEGKSVAYVEYDKKTSPYRIMRDIDGYFNEGIVPEQTTMFKTRRPDQSAMSFAQQSMRDYVRKYGNVTYIEVMPVNDDTAKELGYTLEELELMAGVYRGKKGIAIFAREKNTDSDQIETTIYHESVHHLHDIYPELDELAEYLWDNADDIGVLGKIKKNILAKIKGDEDNKKIEMLAFSMEYYAGRGEIDDLIGMVPDEGAKRLIEFITNKTKYGRSETVREDSERGEAGRDTDGQTREQGESSGNAEGENGEGTITPEVRKEMSSAQHGNVTENDKTGAAKTEFGLTDEFFEEDIRFKITKKTRETLTGWFNKRTDLSAEVKEAVMDFIDQYNDTTLQLAMGKWYVQDVIRLPEDAEKCMQAVASAKKAKVDPMKFASPMEIINKYGVVAPKAKPINPDTVPTLKKVKEFENGIAIYDVEESEESRKNLREIINTHYGKNCSPWCLLQGDENGKLTEKSAEYWGDYAAYGKQVAFLKGRLLAFSANKSRTVAWWDRMDAPYKGLPIAEKLTDGRTATAVYSPKTGELMAHENISLKEEKDGVTTIRRWEKVDGPIVEYSKQGANTYEKVYFYTKENLSWIGSLFAKTGGLASVAIGGKRIALYSDGNLLSYAFTDTNKDFWITKESRGWRAAVWGGDKTLNYYLDKKGRLVDFYRNDERITKKALADIVVPEEIVDVVTNPKVYAAQAYDMLEETGINDHTLFKTAITPKVRREMDAISAQAMVNGNYMKAPNGKDSKLTPEQWAMVRAKNFKQWFGDWENDPENASKVVDENGEPMVVHHGTISSRFTTFDDSIRKNSKAPQGTYWFAEDKDNAMTYAGSEDGMYATFLNLRNPAIIDAKDGAWYELPADFEVYDGAEIDEMFDTLEEAQAFAREHNINEDDIEARGVTDTNAFVKRMKDSGKYDGVIIKNVIDAGDQDVEYEVRPTNEYVVFSSNQIKSATDNTGEFSEDADIRFKTKVVDTSKAVLKETPIKLNGMYRFKLKSAFKGIKDTTGQFGYLKAELHVGKNMDIPYKVIFSGSLEGFAVIYIHPDLAKITEDKEKEHTFYIDPMPIKDALWEALKAGVNYYEFKYAKGPYAKVKNPGPFGYHDWQNVEEDAQNESATLFKTRTAPAPTKTQDVYKLMRLGADGKLYPLFIGSAEPIELGTWYDAESPNLGDLTKLASGVHLVNNETGEAMTLDEFKAQHPEIAIKGKRPNVAAINWATENGARWIEIEDKATAQRRYEGESRSYYNLGINGSGQVGQFAMRPGWHAGSLPTMRQIGKGKDKNLRDDSFVWVKGRIPADVDYQSEADANPDKDIPTHIPTDGFYMKATNANAKASQADKMGWYVAGSFIADEIISDAEARSVIDSWNAEHPDAQVEYDYERESGREFDPARGGLVESDTRFKTDPSTMNVDELVEQGKQKVAAGNKEAVDIFMDRIRAINGNLQQLRMAAAAQREYDKKTVDAIVKQAYELLEAGKLNDLSRGEIKRLLGAINGATGKNDLTNSVNRLMDVMIANQLRMGKENIDKFLRIRGKKVDQRGVEVRGRLDIKGQLIMDTIRENIGNDLLDILMRIVDVQEKLTSESEVVRRNAENELIGLEFARQYVENIKDSEKEEKRIRQEIKDAEQEYKDGVRDRKTFVDFANAANEAIRENRIQRVLAYQKLAEDLAKLVTGSITNAGLLRDAEKDRVQKIQHFANSDLKGLPYNEHGKVDSMWWNNPFVRFLLKPLATFDQMLRHFGSKSVNGEGYLWNHFMRGWLRATETEYKGVQAAHEILDAKAREVFRREGIKKWSDIFEIDRKLPTATVTWWDGGEMRDHEVTQGNLLYIYMVNKMTDGKMKLRKMGITEDDVDDIKNALDPRFIALADWIQDEFLPSLRDKYNALHEKLFGASMAAIDSYFPIRVLANAREREVDLGVEESTAKPSTITGSIIKRTRNSLALDILGSNAFDVVLDHIQQMEHWAAFAEFNQDLNTLLSYRRFRNRVQNMSGIYGSGNVVWSNFRSVAELAAGVYQPASKSDSIDKTAINLAKGVTSAKISFRVYTAIKQLLSMPAFVSDARADDLLEFILTPWEAWNWAMENLPLFEKRWKSRQAGDSRLMQTDSDWKLWKTKVVELASRYGMSPNAFVDAVTVAIGARSIYESKKRIYMKMGYQYEEASERAKQDATILFNESQQSNESAFLSTMQVDRTAASVAFSLFRNSAMGYQRMFVDALRNIKRKFTKGYKEESIEFMKKQLIRDGLEETAAEKAAKRMYTRSNMHSAMRAVTFGFVVQFAWNLGAYLPYLIAGDDDDEKRDMVKDAARHALFGPIEGLSGGSVLSEMGNLVASGEGLKDYDPTLLPVVSDMKRLLNMFSYDEVAAANEMFNLLIQAGIGVNPQTLTDSAVAIIDACNGDLKTATEATLCLLRILQIPQTLADKIYIDEIDFTADKGLELTIYEFAKRYADYKVKRGAPLTGWMYSSEKEQERIDKYIKRFDKMAEEYKRSRGNEEAKKYYEYLDTEYKEVTETIADLKRKAQAESMKGNMVGAMEYAEMLDEFMKTDVFQRYTQYGGMVKAVEKLRDQLLKVDNPTMEMLEDTMLKIRKEMVEEMEKAND